MKFVFLLFGIISLGYATPVAELINEEWIEFKLDHSKEYKNEEEELFRLKVFLENKYKIAKHNQLYDQKRVSFRLAMNKFGDLLNDEFSKLMNGFHGANVMKWDELEVPTWKIGMSHSEQINENFTDSMDWRKSGAVTDIKDQGQCGSCWAFSATGALEGQHFRSTGVLVSLSEQNLIDCSGKYGNHGCNGGTMNKAFQYVKENGGIDTEKSYPYRGEQSSCKYNPKEIGATCCGYKNIKSGCERCLTSAISSVGPISVGIDTDHFSFQFYSKGIYYEPACSTYNLNHAVLAVGYGTDINNEEYYILKNSWSPGWGENGYMKMARNRGNSCGIATMASYPLVCANV